VAARRCDVREAVAVTNGGGTTSTGTNLGPFERIRDVSPQAPLPDLLPVRQHYDVPVEADVPAATRRELEALRPRITAGMRIAITAGSRGIHDIATVIKAAGAWLREQGAEPFIVPAMGSHGDANADGQVAVLASYGITEQSMGVPVRATMDTVVLGQVPDGPEVHLDANAAQADGILLVNRIKPHTDFHGPVESGLGKIAAIGLGKQRGAEGIHAYGSNGLARWMPAVARRIVDTGKVLGGIAIVENAHETTAKVAFVGPDGIAGPAETALLDEAGELLGRLPFDDLDVLVVDELGKDKSGSGMDTNVIGRPTNPFEPFPADPKITWIVALDITEESYGNATGIGNADFTTRRLVDKIDMKATLINTITACAPGGAKIPATFETDREAIATALDCIGLTPPERARVVRIKNTLMLGELEVSEAFAADVARRSDLTRLGEAPLGFDAAGRLIPF
jgi:hypothetical protein